MNKEIYYLDKRQKMKYGATFSLKIMLKKGKEKSIEFSRCYCSNMQIEKLETIVSDLIKSLNLGRIKSYDFKKNMSYQDCLLLKLKA